MSGDLTDINVGSVSVTVVPDARRFGTDLDRQLSPEAAAIGRQIAQDIADPIAREVAASISEGMGLGATGAGTEGRRAGGAFADGFRQRVDAALRSLPPAKVGADATEFDAELIDIRERMEAMRDLRIGVDLQANYALAEIESLKLRLDELAAKSPDVQVRVDTFAAASQLAAFEAEVEALDGKTIDIDTNDAERGVSGLLTSILGIGPALIPIGAASVAGLAGVGVVAGSVAGALGTVVLGSSGVIEALKAVNTEGATPTAANLAKMRAQLDKLGPAGRGFVVFLHNDLLPELNQLKRTAQDGLLPGVETGLRALQPLLPGINHFVGDLSHTLGGLAAEAGKALDTGFWHGFFTYVDSAAGPTLVVFSHIVGNLGKGFAGLLQAFAPLEQQMGAGLDRLAGDFANFGAHASENEGFQHFLAYVQSEGPVVIHVLGDITGATGHLLVALAPLGGVGLRVLQGIANALDAIPTPVLTGLAFAVTSVVVALKAADLATKAWDKSIGRFGLTGAGIGLGLAAIATGLSYAHTWFDRTDESVKQLHSDLDTALGNTGQSFEAWSAQVGRTFTAAGSAANGFDNEIKKVGNFTIFDSLRHPIETVTALGSAMHDSAGDARDLQTEAAHAVGNVEALTETFLGVPTNAAMSQMLSTLNQMGVTTADLAGPFADVKAKVEDFLSSEDNATAPTLSLRQAIAQLDGSARNAEADIEALTTAVAALIGGPLAEHQNALQFADDLRKMGAAAAHSTGEINDNTKAGKKNAEMVQALAADVVQSISTWSKNGETVDEIRPKLLAMERQLQKVAERTVGSKKAADDYLGSMHLLPSQIDDVIGTLGKVPAAADAAAAGVKQGGAKAVHAAESVARDIRHTLRTLKSDGKQGGVDFGAGLVLGLQHEMGAVSVESKLLADQVAKQMRLAHDSHSPSRVAIRIGSDFGEGLNIGLERWVPMVTSTAQKLADAATQTVMRAIARAVAPDVTDRDVLANILARTTSHAVNSQITANAKGAHAQDLQGVLDDLTKVNHNAADALLNTAKSADTLHDAIDALNAKPINGTTVAAADRYAKTLRHAADQAQYHATQMATDTKAERAAKAAAEEHARTLAHEATEAQNAADRIKHKFDNLAAGAKKAADAAKQAADRAQQAADRATQKAEDAAQALVSNLQNALDTMLGQIADFRSQVEQGLTGGFSFGTIWQSVAGTDSEGNPIAPTLDQFEAGLQGVLAATEKFATDIQALADEGLSQDAISQILGMGPTAGDQLATEILNAGAPAIDAVNTTLGQITDTATTTSGILAGTFYGAGLNSIGQFILGLEKRFPDLIKALQPMIDLINSVLGVLGQPLIATTTTTAKSSGPTYPVTFGGGWGALKGYIPGFADGVDNFEGGLALVGERGPELVTLPTGSSVTPLTYNGSSGAPLSSSLSRDLVRSGAGTAVLADEDRELLRAVAGLADRPVEVAIDGRQVAKSVKSYNREDVLHGRR